MTVLNSERQRDIALPMRGSKFLFFFSTYSVITIIVFGIWASAPHSNLVFVACLWILVLTPFALRRHSIFEPVSIYMAVFVPAFTIKLLLNEYLASMGEGFLFALSGNERLYEIGFPFAVLFVLVHIYLVHIVYSWATRHKRKCFFLRPNASRLQNERPHPKELRVWKRTAFVGLLVYIPALIYFIVVIQGLNYLEYAANRNELLRGQGLAWLLATLGTPLTITYIYLLLLERTSRRRLYLMLAMFCVISGQFVAPGRGNLLNIMIASIIIFWMKRGSVSFVRLFILGIIFSIFSFAVLHVREGETPFNNDSVVFFISQDLGMFDYYVIYVGQMLSSSLDLSYGAQLFRNFYVFLPRIIFPSKPLVYSTLEIQDANQLIPVEVSHVSITPFVEWLFNFGILGILIGSVLLAVILATFFRLLATRGADVRLIAYVLFFPAFVIGYIKGGVSLAFMFFLLSPAWLVVAIYFGVRHLHVFPSDRKRQVNLGSVAPRDAS